VFHGTLTLVMKMKRILLIEPNYKNKYPPIGLMKISTYYKNKGDFVEFHKGLLPQTEVRTFDKVLITTLFTFDFNMCIQTIRYYIAIVGLDNVFVGGIAATIMRENFTAEIPGLNILTGQLSSSSMLGYEDNVNIDALELDYDILWDVSYDYPMANSYFIYTSRGCPRKCKFCAVKTLEPNFYDCNNIEDQIKNVDIRFGTKKHLLIMDNNILYSQNFDNTVENIKDLGFGTNNNKIKKNSNMRYYLVGLTERIRINKKYDNLLNRIKKEFVNLKVNRISKKDLSILQNVIEKIDKISDFELISYILDNYNFVVDFFERYNYHTITRYVDFNQGLDARLFTNDKARKLSELAVNPCRIAFDKLDDKTEYFNAMKLCVDSGITRFSNYLLYNFEEKPEDLWSRLQLNVTFCKEHKNIQLFSFPMKYASINHTDRSFVGEHWNKKYLRAINVILNVTSGVVAKEEDFFLRAFGHSESEFLQILTMPDEFIRYRDFFEEKGLTQLWRKSYLKLSLQEKEELIGIVEKIVDDPEIIHKKYCEKIKDILFYYSIKKKHVTDNELYYSNLVHISM
jgi:hypothetical protein